jgi:hypothetical protein
VSSAFSVPWLFNTSPFAAKGGAGEFLVESRGLRVIEQEVARILHSDLKC